MQPVLLLFDVDGTLLLSGGASTRGIHRAFREILGDRFRPAPITAGTLDQQIFRELARYNGIVDAPSPLPAYKQAYLAALRDELAANPGAHALPGVQALLHTLIKRTGTITGLLTGNFHDAVLLKLAAAKIDPAIFAVGAFAEDGQRRAELVPVAIRKALPIAGCAIEPKQVILIGDTPRDIECARETGCRVLAVATGQYSLEALQAHRPDAVVRDLTDTGPLMRLIELVSGR